jgi:hypothetical protein
MPITSLHLPEAAKGLDPSKRGTSGVRPFVEEDIPQVSDLHWRLRGNADDSTVPAEQYRRFFSDVFVPSSSSTGLNSLVYQDGDGSIVGFQGVHPRPMMFEEQPIVMAVCSHFVVDSAHRGVPGLRLLKKLMEGPQDLTLADESNETARRLWEWCGGTTSLLYSMHWVRPLRLAEAAVTLLLRSRSPRVSRLAAPIARIVDALCNRFALIPLRTLPAEGSRQNLDEATLAARLPEFTGARSLRPDYGDGLLTWVLERASTRNAGGEFRQVVVKDDKQEIAGWYVYFANRGGIGEVLQIAARKGAIGQVLDHLIDDGLRSGVVALAGRLDPAYAQEMSERHCLFYRRGNWTLIHSRRPELLHAIERGDAFLSRLEGEFCLRFQ